MPSAPLRRFEWARLTLRERLEDLAGRISGRIVFTTSFGIEDQAITHAIAEAGVPVDIVTLDTGRMFPETYRVWTETEARYGIRVSACYPERADLEELVARQGVNGFYDSLAARHACCDVRKVRPLSRALAGASAWVTGLRASQSGVRQSAAFVETDHQRSLLKVNPLLDWSREAVVNFTRDNSIPVNVLHAQGFPSIGCAPCTRAIAPGEDERAGRWWWENSNKECGLHVGPDGRLVRASHNEDVSA